MRYSACGVHVVEKGELATWKTRAISFQVDIPARTLIMAATTVKLFNKWSFEDVTVADLSLKDYIAVDKQASFIAFSHERHETATFVSIVFCESALPL
jgi:hypothetical protein